MASRLFVCDDSGDELWEILDPDGSCCRRLKPHAPRNSN